MDGWKTTFLLGWPIFKGELLVSGSVFEYIQGFNLISWYLYQPKHGVHHRYFRFLRWPITSNPTSLSAVSEHVFIDHHIFIHFLWPFEVDSEYSPENENSSPLKMDGQWLQRLLSFWEDDFSGAKCYIFCVASILRCWCPYGNSDGCTANAHFATEAWIS